MDTSEMHGSSRKAHTDRFLVYFTYTSITNEIQSISSNLPAWELHWLILAALSWTLWKERNTPPKKGNKMQKEDRLQQCIDTTETGFWAAKFKTMHQNPLEAAALEACRAMVLDIQCMGKITN